MPDEGIPQMTTKSDRQCMDVSQSRIRKKEETTPTEKYISKMHNVIADHY